MLSLNPDQHFSFLITTEGFLTTPLVEKHITMEEGKPSSEAGLCGGLRGRCHVQPPLPHSIRLCCTRRPYSLLLPEAEQAPPLAATAARFIPGQLREVGHTRTRAKTAAL